MNKRRICNFLCLAIVLAAVAAVSYRTGCIRTAHRLNAETGYAIFYAEIEEIDGNALTIRGLSVNDKNHRGHYRCSVGDETALHWSGRDISLSDLYVGNTVSVAYLGPVADSDPAGLGTVSCVVLLDDRLGQPVRSMARRYGF